MSNIVTAKVKYQQGRTSPLFQYDYGQILKIEGIELPTAYEVHFANSPTAPDSIIQIGDENGVEIPNEILRLSGVAYAWLFLHTGETDGETKVVITIPIEARARYHDVSPTPEQQDAISEAITLLNLAVEDCEEVVDDCREMVDNLIDDTSADADKVWSAQKLDGLFRPIEWVNMGTITVDGTSATLDYLIPDTGEDDDYFGFFVRAAVTPSGAETNATFGVVAEFEDGTRKGLGDVNDAIRPEAAGYMNAHFARDVGGLWTGWITGRTGSPVGATAMMERIDGFYFGNSKLVKIEMRTTTEGAVLPEGSSFEIYLLVKE